MTDNRKTEFLQKFKELLKEYDVTIDFSFEGDTHGIHDEKVSILHRVSKKSFEEEEWLVLEYRSSINEEDI